MVLQVTNCKNVPGWRIKYSSEGKTRSSSRTAGFLLPAHKILRCMDFLMPNAYLDIIN